MPNIACIIHRTRMYTNTRKKKGFSKENQKIFHYDNTVFSRREKIVQKWLARGGPFYWDIKIFAFFPFPFFHHFGIFFLHFLVMMYPEFFYSSKNREAYKWPEIWINKIGRKWLLEEIPRLPSHKETVFRWKIRARESNIRLQFPDWQGVTV